MAKDPAFLFYSSDFLSGTQFFTHEQKGKYITLLCLQHQHGHLQEKHMLMICGTYDNDLFEKFTKDADGLYYQQRLEMEIERRKKYSESRRDNRLKGIAKQPVDNKKKPTKKMSRKKKINEEIIYPFNSDNFLKYWKQWKIYKANEYNYEYASAQSEQAALRKLARLANNTEQTAIDIILESMANGWKGLFELKNNHQYVGRNNNNTERNPGIKQAIYDTIGDTSRSF